MTDTSYANWDAVYRDNVTWVYRLMYAKVGNRPDAEGLTAEVFMTALRPMRPGATAPTREGVAAPGFTPGRPERCGGHVRSERTVREFVGDLLRGRRTRPARPDEFEAAQMAAAIELRSARTGSDAPSEEFVADLHRRLAEQMADEQPPARPVSGTRRQAVVGTGVAAASAVAGIVIGRNLLASKSPVPQAEPSLQGTLEPNGGTWRAVGSTADLRQAAPWPSTSVR